jgi:hypothetical protein
MQNERQEGEKSTRKDKPQRSVEHHTMHYGTKDGVSEGEKRGSGTYLMKLWLTTFQEVRKKFNK